ncbi:MAG TPA: hypothetical protein VM901_09090 [Bdellovibrionota bacterium]|nr:hypothetical protein [Bdellovibrionota bacterium]
MVKLVANAFIKTYGDQEFTPEYRRRVSQQMQATVQRFSEAFNDARNTAPLGEEAVVKIIGGLLSDRAAKNGKSATADALYEVLVKKIGDTIIYSARGQRDAKEQLYKLQTEMDSHGDVMSDYHAFVRRHPEVKDVVDPIIAAHTKVQVDDSAEQIANNDLFLKNLMQSEEGFKLITDMLKKNAQGQALTLKAAKGMQAGLAELMKTITEPKTPTPEEVRAAKVDNYLAVVQIYSDLGSLISDPGVRNFVVKSSLVASTIGKIQRAIINPDKLSTHLLTANIVGAVVSLFQGFLGGGPSTDEIILEEIGKLQQSVNDLHKSMNAQFEHLNLKLDVMFEQMNAGFDAVLSAQGVNRVELQRIQSQLTAMSSEIEALTDLSLAGTQAILSEIRLSDVSYCLNASKYFKKDLNSARDITGCLNRLSDFATRTARQSVLSGIGSDEAKLVGSASWLVSRRSAYNLFAAPNTVSEIDAAEVAKMALWSPVSRLNNLAAIARVSYGYDIFSATNSGGETGIELFPHPEHWLHNTGAALNLVDHYREKLASEDVLPTAEYYETLYQSGESIRTAVHALRQRPLLETIVARNTTAQVETQLLLKALEYQFLACNGLYAAPNCVAMGSQLLGIFQEEITKINDPLTAAHYDQVIEAVDARLTDPKGALASAGLLEHRKDFWMVVPVSSTLKIKFPERARAIKEKKSVGDLTIGVSDEFLKPLTRVYIQLGLTEERPEKWSFGYDYQSVGNNVMKDTQDGWLINKLAVNAIKDFSNSEYLTGNAYSTIESVFRLSEANLIACKQTTPVKVGQFLLHRWTGMSRSASTTIKVSENITSRDSKRLKHRTSQFKLKSVAEAVEDEDYSKLNCVDELDQEAARKKIEERITALRTELQLRLQNAFGGTSAANVYYPIIQAISERSKQIAATNVYFSQLLALATGASEALQNQFATMLVTGQVLPTTQITSELLKTEPSVYTRKTFESAETMAAEIREKVIPALTAIPSDQTIAPIDHALRELETLRQ